MINTSSGKGTWGLFFSALILLIPLTSLAQQWLQVDNNDIPTPQSLTAVWTTSSITPQPEDIITTEIFCTGENGTIIYFDGSTWESQGPGVNNLNAIWGSSPTDVFAVGESGTILHYNGTVWETSPSPSSNNLNGIWGSSENNVFAVGANGTILHYNGTSWTSQGPGGNNLNAIWGSSSTDVFAVGNLLTILHYDGQEWELQTSPQYTSLNGVWGTSPDNVFAVGESGTILWYDGEIWTSLSSGISREIVLNALWGASACNIYAVGRVSGFGTIYHFDGSTWSSQANLITPSNPSPLFGIWGNSMRDIHAAGNGPTLIDYDPEGDVFPMVCITSPADGEGDASIDTSIRAFFSTEMDPETINAATFTVSDGSGLVAGTVTYESGGIAVFTPENSLEYGTTYTATLSTAVNDPYRFGIESDYTWAFVTTGDDSSESGGSGGCFLSAARMTAATEYSGCCYHARMCFPSDTR